MLLVVANHAGPTLCLFCCGALRRFTCDHPVRHGGAGSVSCRAVPRHRGRPPTTGPASAPCPRLALHRSTCQHRPRTSGAVTVVVYDACAARA